MLKELLITIIMGASMLMRTIMATHMATDMDMDMEKVMDMGTHLLKVKAKKIKAITCVNSMAIMPSS
jgi:hypothetical protein